MPWQVDDLQIPKRNMFPALYIDAWVHKVRKSRVRRRRSRVRRSRRGPKAPNRSQTRWGIVVEVKLTRVKFWMIVVTWLPLRELSALRVTLLQLPLSLDASSVERGIVKEKWGPGEKTSQPNEGDWGGKLGDHWEHPSPVEKLMSLKKSCCWWKISQLMKETGKENWTKDQSMKNLEINERDWGRKPKDHKV